MKKIVMRSVSLLLLFAVFCTLAVGCTPASEKAAVSYEDYQVSRALFYYLCCLKKTNYLYEAYGVSSDKVSSSELQDNPQIWQAKDADGVTVADSLKLQVLEMVQSYLYFCQQAKDLGYELNTQQKNMVIDEFASMIARNFDDKKAFNQAMKPYQIDYDKMMDYQMLQALAYQGEDLLFGENGKMAISPEGAKKYFKDHYITVDCVFINTENKTFANGKVVVLPAEEKEAKKALADDLTQKLSSGTPIAELYQYADQVLEENTATEGYTFEQGGFLNKKAEEKAFTLKEGETARVDTEHGTYLIARRALNMDYYNQRSASILALLKQVKKTALISEVQEKFVIDHEYLESLDIVSMPHVV